MKMIKFFFPASLLGMSILGLSQAVVIHEVLPDMKTKINFSQSDTSTYDEESKTWYRAYNDSSAIHVVLKTGDIAQQRKIIINGLEVWIDTKGKKNKTIGVIFPLGNEERSSNDFQGSTQNRTQNITGLQKEMIKRLQSVLESKTNMKLHGFAKEFNDVHLINSLGFNMSVFFLNDTLYYHATIPFHAFNKALNAQSIINIGIDEKGLMPMGMDDGGMLGDGGPPPGGGGEGMPPGPPPGGGGLPADDGNMQNIFQDNIIWFKSTIR